MLNPEKEKELLNALWSAEQSLDQGLIDKAVNELALYYAMTDQFLIAAPFWRRGAELLSKNTAPDSRELGTYLHTMATMCLIPAGLHDEARTMLCDQRKFMHFILVLTLGFYVKLMSYSMQLGDQANALDVVLLPGSYRLPAWCRPSFAEPEKGRKGCNLSLHHRPLDTDL